MNCCAHEPIRSIDFDDETYANGSMFDLDLGIVILEETSSDQ
jgi:hypothetical protein